MHRECCYSCSWDVVHWDTCRITLKGCKPTKFNQYENQKRAVTKALWKHCVAYCACFVLCIYSYTQAIQYAHPLKRWFVTALYLECYREPRTFFTTHKTLSFTRCRNGDIQMLAINSVCCQFKHRPSEQRCICPRGRKFTSKWTSLRCCHYFNTENLDFCARFFTPGVRGPETSPS